MSYPARAEGLVNSIKRYPYSNIHSFCLRLLCFFSKDKCRYLDISLGSHQTQMWYNVTFLWDAMLDVNLFRVCFNNAWFNRHFLLGVPLQPSNYPLLREEKIRPGVNSFGSLEPNCFYFWATRLEKILYVNEC